MKKGLLAVSTVLLFGIILMGCATKGDLERMQAQQQQTNLKADQALKASQEANEAAKTSQAADQKADEALKAAQQANESARAAEERAQAAEAQVEAAKANNTFKQSMKK